MSEASDRDERPAAEAPAAPRPSGGPAADEPGDAPEAPRTADERDERDPAPGPDGGEEAAGQLSSADSGRRRLLRRFGPAVVAILIAVFASPLASRWPSSQTVEIALEAPAEVTRVSLEISEHGGTDPIFSTTWNFERGAAPERVRAEVAAPNGSYDAAIGVVRAGAAPRDELKRVDLDGNRVTLFAR